MATSDLQNTPEKPPAKEEKLSPLHRKKFFGLPIGHKVDHNDLTPVTADDFQSKVLEAKKPVVVYIHASWCMPCRAFGPLVGKLAKEEKNEFSTYSLDGSAEKSREKDLIKENYPVTAIPTLLIFEGGKLKGQLTGSLSPSGKIDQATGTTARISQQELKEFIQGLLRK